MSQTRIYVVIHKDKPNRLVEAVSAAQAIRHCVQNEYQAKPASPKDVAQNLVAGAAIEHAHEQTT